MNSIRSGTMCEMESPYYDKALHETHGRLYVLERTADSPEHFHLDDVKFQGYLKGDGDFRSEEVTKLRDEADIIITNPPFSLFREFLHWIVEADKQFLIIGNMNAIAYKEVFPMLKENKMWLGYTHPKQFKVLEEEADTFARNNLERQQDGSYLATFGNINWFTNLDLFKRHEPLMLAPACDNLRYNKKFRKVLIEKYGQDPEHCHYEKYDNYDAIEVPYVQVIPNDYREGIGVPISFLDKWNPEQFEIVGADFELAKPEPLPDGKIGTGRFYVVPEIVGGVEQPSIALVLSLSYSKEELSQALAIMGVPPKQMRYQSGIMGVPISFMDKYNPEQFSIIGLDRYTVPPNFLVGGRVAIRGMPTYARILITWK